MKRIRGFLNFNPYLKDPEFTQATVQLSKSFKLNDIKSKDIAVMSGLIQYPKKWEKHTDIFQAILEEFRENFVQNKKVFFLFDASTEGFSPIYSEPFFDILYKMCDDHKIDPHRIFFISSNMKDNENIIRFNMENNRERSINVFTFLNFEQQILGVTGQTEVRLDQGIPLEKIINRRYKNAFRKTKELYSNLNNTEFSKIGLSLSRVNRPHRTYSAMQIYNSKYRNAFHLSHASLKGVNLDYLLQQQPFTNSGISYPQLKTFKQQLPLIVDTTDFKTNHANGLHGELNEQTLFQLVNETHLNDWKGTSLFYSEKTFRSIYHMQPFLIWGQQGLNRRFADYGYKLYDDWFDYSFDDIKDPVKRWNALWKEITKKIDYIRDMRSLSQHIAWKFKNENVLKHNFRTLLEGKYTQEIFKKMALRMREVADE
tara:strand:- start:1948 stop:3228 length:1281 start_codon:yes stop_codon:yes gene_type:complete